ncbi:MAG: hypothetical protein JXD22_03470 [Sedimentisphaerales bacterium]|nr:hypothetical protein [Sedimentisphaerales bacterium]
MSLEKTAKPKCGLVLMECLRFQGLGEGTAGGTYDSRVEEKASGLVEKFSADFEVVCPKMISSREAVPQTIKQLVEQDVDFIIAAFLSWSEDFAWIRFLRDVPDIPMIFYLPVEKDTKFEGISTDNLIRFLASGGLVGTLEGSGSVKRMNKKIRVIVETGSEGTRSRIKAFGLAAHADNVLKRSRLGLVSHFNEIMWSTYVDPYDFFVQVGPELTFISYNRLKDAIDNVPDSDVNEYVNQLKSDYKVLPDVDDKLFFESAKASIGLYHLADGMGLDGLALNDVDMELFEMIGLRPGFYYPGFGENSRILSPEGDVGIAALTLAAKVMTGKHINFVEPFYLDVNDCSFTAGHAGPNDYTDSRFKDNVIIAADERFRSQPFKYAGAPFAWYRIPAGAKTLAHFSQCKDNYKLVTLTAESMPGEHILTGYSHSVFKTSAPVNEVFEKIISIGTTQHFIVIEDDVRQYLAEYAYIKGFDYHSI